MHGLQTQWSQGLRRGARRDRTLWEGDEPAEIELTYSITSAPTDPTGARQVSSVHNLGYTFRTTPRKKIMVIDDDKGFRESPHRSPRRCRARNFESRRWRAAVAIGERLKG